MALEELGIYFLACIMLALAPGPDNLFVLTQSALYGRNAGWLVTAGLCTGLLVHTAAVTFGVAAVFNTSETAFLILKIAGASYLVVLAIQALRAGASRVDHDSQPRLSAARLYRRGIIMNVTNPKVSIFFLAFLPQFADPARGSLTMQLLLLGALFIVATMLVFGSVAVLAGSLGNWLNRSPNAQRTMHWVAAGIFLGLALKLITAVKG